MLAFCKPLQMAAGIAGLLGGRQQIKSCQRSLMSFGQLSIYIIATNNAG